MDSHGRDRLFSAVTICHSRLVSSRNCFYFDLFHGDGFCLTPSAPFFSIDLFLKDFPGSFSFGDIEKLDFLIRRRPTNLLFVLTGTAACLGWPLQKTNKNDNKSITAYVVR